MDIDLNEIRRALHRRLNDVAEYREAELTLAGVIGRAAEIAVQAVNDLAERYRSVADIPAEERRFALAAEKRQRAYGPHW